MMNTQHIKELSDRITQYLVSGGLFNPESMDHDAVKELLIECRWVLDEAAHVWKNFGNNMDNHREHIGYIEREEGFYNLYAPPKGSLVTQAFILCKYCDGSIYHCMGPKYDAVCFDCYEKDPELRKNDYSNT